jgi:hypothetical protein
MGFGFVFGAAAGHKIRLLTEANQRNPFKTTIPPNVNPNNPDTAQIPFIASKLCTLAVPGKDGSTLLHVKSEDVNTIFRKNQKKGKRG